MPHAFLRHLVCTSNRLLGMTKGQGPERKALEGFAHRFRPTYAGANVGHPYGAVGLARGLRGRPAVSHISRKTSEMWGETGTDGGDRA
jgi:hypothetical protein